MNSGPHPVNIREATLGGGLHPEIFFTYFCASAVWAVHLWACSAAADETTSKQACARDLTSMLHHVYSIVSGKEPARRIEVYVARFRAGNENTCTATVALCCKYERKGSGARAAEASTGSPSWYKGFKQVLLGTPGPREAPRNLFSAFSQP